MHLVNDENVSGLLYDLLKYEGTMSIKDASEIDLLDYHWFIVSILEGIEKQFTIKLLDINDDYEQDYKIIDGEINDDKLNELSLTLKNIEDNVISEHSFEIESVDDARSPTTMKYFVKTKDNKYRFHILGL
ncbi:hypothetical protein [Clostridium estertheticum]|uniref:hypothetical protein n=1 Tax=Clostridium estertheticum TaxID=238834 RepID=UPI001CF4FDF1|nr:hypothetical protein [Clostridium estertheticum]MCB2359430.1 hypothetical protein [Clostridium estertheticum]